MATFTASGATYQVTTVASTATQIYNTLGPSSTGITSGTQLTNLTVTNSGSVTVYLGSSSVTAATGLVLLAGQSIVIQGTPVAAASGAVWNLYAITASGTSVVETGLGSLVSTV